MSLDVHINLLQKIYLLRKLCTTQLGLSFWLKAVDAKAKTIQKQNITAWSNGVKIDMESFDLLTNRRRKTKRTIS